MLVVRLAVCHLLAEYLFGLSQQRKQHGTRSTSNLNKSITILLYVYDEIMSISVAKVRESKRKHFELQDILGYLRTKEYLQFVKDNG